MEAPSQNCGGVAVLSRASLWFKIEAIQKFGQNVVRFKMATGDWRWYIIGCYLYPGDASMIESVVAALRERSQGPELLLVEDFNAELAQLEGKERDENIAAALAAESLEDMLSHFLP